MAVMCVSRSPQAEVVEDRAGAVEAAEEAFATEAMIAEAVDETIAVIMVGIVAMTEEEEEEETIAEEVIVVLMMIEEEIAMTAAMVDLTEKTADVVIAIVVIDLVTVREH